jgi:hypothetical protein
MTAKAAAAAAAAAGFVNHREALQCTLLLRELGDEKASISVTALEDFSSRQLAQQQQQQRCSLDGAAVKQGAVFAMPLALPSIMALDAELVQEFFNNITENIQLLYDRSTNKISLCLKE